MYVCVLDAVWRLRLRVPDVVRRLRVVEARVVASNGFGMLPLRLRGGS